MIRVYMNFATDKLDASYEYDDLSESNSSPEDEFTVWKEGVVKTLEI